MFICDSEINTYGASKRKRFHDKRRWCAFKEALSNTRSARVILFPKLSGSTGNVVK